MGVGPASFGALVRQYRQRAALSQAALAERAGLSADAISVIERGKRGAPRAETVALLARALDLSEQERAAFVAAARLMGGTETVAAISEPDGHSRRMLPAALSSFIGREREVAALCTRLAAPATTRLLTLTGAGGMGKTRLALAVAEEVLTAYPDGVCLVELAPLGEPALVPGAVAQALDLCEEPDRTVAETLLDQLRERRLLLVLDNCEHLIDACAALASTLLRGCPALRILATSREALGITGEVVWPVPPLTIPAPVRAGSQVSAATVYECESVQLLLARARERRPNFGLTEQNAAAVADVVRRLDGLPLAIELAAARLTALSVEQVAARLDDRFRLLTGGSRVALPRQQTLRAALDWSHDLLSVPEQALLRRLAAFAAEATLEAVEAVCAGEEVAAADVLDLLGGLASKSLVQVWEQDGATRHGLLETVRAYAWEQLAASGETEATALAHVRHYLALAEAAEPRLNGPEQASWLARLEGEHDNLRAALRWAIRHDEAEIALRLAAALWRFWATHGHLREGQDWLAGLLAPDAPTVPMVVRARALNAAGNLAQLLSDYARARAWHEEALALRRAMGDRQGISRSLTNLGNVAAEMADYAAAVALFEESVALDRALGDRLGMSKPLHNLGRIAYERGDYPGAVALLEEALAIQRDVGDLVGVGISLSSLGIVAAARGDPARAEMLYEESLALRRQLGDRVGYGFILRLLGTLLAEQGKMREALERLRDSVEIMREAGDRKNLAAALNQLARVLVALGDPDGAGALCAEGMEIHEASGERRGVAEALQTLGRIAAARGDHVQALATLARCVHLARQLENRTLQVECLEEVAAVYAAQGEEVHAVRLCGATTALRGALGAPRSPAEQATVERIVAAVRASLGEAAYQAAWREGSGLALDAVVEEVVKEHAPRDDASAR
jgi:predicted ATPase/transcriptional regulator with XRE-family HTH domain